MSHNKITWSDVISENQPKLLAYLTNILKCPYLAEDALQDTFIRLAGMSAFQNAEIQNSTSFCYQVARNIAIDILRKKNRESILDIDVAQYDQITDENANIEHIYIQKQLSRKVDTTIKKLSKRHQNIVSFIRQGKLKQKEIAKVYQISPTLVNFMIKEVIYSCQCELN